MFSLFFSWLFLHLTFFQKKFIDSCLGNLVLTVFKECEIETLVLFEELKKEQVSIYLNHKQTKPATYSFFLCDSKLLKAYENT